MKLLKKEHWFRKFLKFKKDGNHCSETIFLNLEERPSKLLMEVKSKFREERLENFVGRQFWCVKKDCSEN